MRTRKRITITIATDGAAFDDCEHGEIAKILRGTAKRFAEQSYELTGVVSLFEKNGNVCGYLKIEEIH